MICNINFYAFSMQTMISYTKELLVEFDSFLYRLNLWLSESTSISRRLNIPYSRYRLNLRSIEVTDSTSRYRLNLWSIDSTDSTSWYRLNLWSIEFTDSTPRYRLNLWSIDSTDSTSWYRLNLWSIEFTDCTSG